MDELDIDIKWKIRKLVNVILKCEEGENLKGGHMNPNAIISAVAELNKMQGDYSPDKSMNLHVDCEEEDKELLNKFMNTIVDPKFETKDY